MPPDVLWAHYKQAPMSTHISSATAALPRLRDCVDAGQAQDLTVHDSDRAALIRGLVARPAAVSPKYLYDSLGSKLFEALCLLPEYYLTRTEAQVMLDHLTDITDAAGPGRTLIDLGAGNCAKAEKLFPTLRPANYVAVDISSHFLTNALNRLQPTYADISMTALAQDFSQGLTLPASIPKKRRLFFYPGSSLGNFGPTEAQGFLRGLRAHGAEDASLLLGIDLVKEPAVLNAAYDDALGVTSAFNLNLLRNLNRILSANFKIEDWRHRAGFNPQASRIEMYLEAQHGVKVVWPGGNRRFEAGERIHTENSYKYTPATLSALLQGTGWKLSHFWTDPAGWFGVAYATAVPPFLR